MLPSDAEPLAEASQALLFERVADFICAHSPVAAYRDAARTRSLRERVWTPHWPALREASLGEAALLMCFLLACATLRIDARRAAAAVRQATDPGSSMRIFLYERGLLRASAFEAPDAAAATRAPAPCATAAGPR